MLSVRPLDEAGKQMQPEQPLLRQTTFRCFNAAISSALKPNSARTSSVCSPNSGGGADRLRAAFPNPPAGGGNVDIAIGGLEHAGRNAGRMVIASLAGYFFLHQPARGLEIEHEYLRLQQRGLHPLPLTGDLPLQKGR